MELVKDQHLCNWQYNQQHLYVACQVSTLVMLQLPIRSQYSDWTCKDTTKSHNAATTILDNLKCIQIPLALSTLAMFCGHTCQSNNNWCKQVDNNGYQCQALYTCRRACCFEPNMYGEVGTDTIWRGVCIHVARTHTHTHTTASKVGWEKHKSQFRFARPLHLRNCC